MVSEKIRRQELSEFLKTRRARVSPEIAGLSNGHRRRTPGLRREEVAHLAGVGVTWYTWLEQGRDISVSDEVLESIARTLQLSPPEINHLFALAKRQLPLDLPISEERISSAMETLLDHQGIFPAFITGRRWDFLAWNQSASLLMGNLDALEESERNHIWHIFVNPTVRQCLEDWEIHAQRMLAEFRVQYGKHIHEEQFIHLVDRLNQASPEFREWWPRHDVVGRLNINKTFIHPELGRLEFEQTTLMVSESPDMKLVIKIPLPGTPTLEVLQRLF